MLLEGALPSEALVADLALVGLIPSVNCLIDGGVSENICPIR